jgi:autotransporter-associated beta strand protein
MKVAAMAPFSWSRWLRSLVRPAVRAYRSPRRSRALQLESLEMRLAPASFTWTGASKTTNHWSDAANWLGGVAPSGAGDDLLFPVVAMQKANRNDLTSGTGNPIFDSITIAGSGYSLSGGALTLTNTSSTSSLIVGAGAAGDVMSMDIQLGLVGTPQFFTVNNGADLTLSGHLFGSSGSELDKDGAGLLVLTRDDSGFEGNMAVVPNGGILRITNANALGDPQGGLTTSVGTNAQLQVSNIPSNGQIRENLILNGSGIKSDGALLNVSGSNIWAGPVTIDSDVTFGATAGTMRITGQIGDRGAGHNVTKEGPGQVTFASADTYRGTTTINDGILQIQNGLSLGPGDNTSATAVTVNESVTSAGIILKAGTLRLNSASFGGGITVASHLLNLNGDGKGGIGALDNLNGFNTWTGNVLLGTPTPPGQEPNVSDVAVGNDTLDPAYTLTISGVISQAAGNTYTFTKVGPGIVVLTSANTYTGSTFVANGTLEIRDSQALGNSPLATVEDGATLELNVSNKTTDSVTGLANELNVSTPVNITGLGVAGVGALYSDSGINTYSGSVTLSGQVASIGVAADPNETNGTAYFTNDYSLTVTGNIIGNRSNVLDKLNFGQLILPNPNLLLTSDIDIQAGWITIENGNSLGGHADGLGDTVQPRVTVENGAALMLNPLQGNLVVPQNLTLSGNGINHVFGLINQQGAVENLAGINLLTGNIVLKGQVGIGVENVFGLPSQLTTAGTIGEKNPVINLGATASGGSQESDNIIDTGSTSGTVTVNYNMYYIPDSMDIYYGIKGQGGVLIASTNGQVQGTGTLTGTYGPGPFTTIEIIVDAGGGPPGTFWTYSGSITPTSVGAGGITKLGSQRLILQGDGTYSGSVDIKKGVVLDQNNTGLGAGNGPKSTTTVESGAALELGPTTAQENGGLISGIDVWGEHLVLNGSGNAAFGDAALTVLSPNNPNNPVNDTIITTDDLWRGPVTLGSNASIQVAPDSRLTIFGTIDDPPVLQSPSGSDLTVLGGGELGLAGSNTYRGVTSVQAGIVTLQDGQALGGVPISAVQLLTLSNVVAGTSQFTLSFGNSPPTAPITYTGGIADATNIQDALNALPSITSQGGSVSVVAQGSVFSITFGGYLTGFHQPKLKANITTGPGTASVDISQDGSGGVIVASGASVQLQGGITVAGKPIIVQGQGLPTGPNPPLQWFNVGPAPELNGQTAGNGNVSGRVTGMAVDPTDPNTIYIATAGGGAWKTINGGQTWLPLFDSAYAMYGGAIAVAPSDPRVIYFGTGETDNSLDSFAGTGVYRSNDSGHSWVKLFGTSAPIDPMNGLAVSRIVVDPSNPNLIFVATSDLATNGEFFASQDQNGTPRNPEAVPGVYRYDGAHWTNLTSVVSLARNPATSDKAGAPGTPGPDDDWRLVFPSQQASWTDLQLVGSSANNNLFLYAALGTDVQPSTGTADPANAVYRCEFPYNPFTLQEDVLSNQPAWYIGNGTTDSEQSTEFPSNLVTGAPFQEGTIKLTTFASGNPNFFYFPILNIFDYPTNPPTSTSYAAVAIPDTDAASPGALWTIQTSTDGGVTWATAAGVPANYLGFQGNYDNTIVSPDGVNVYVGGQEADPFSHSQQILWSPDGGATWNDISVDSNGNAPHTDQHALAVDGNGNVDIGGDGGVWQLNTAGGANTWTDINGNLATLTTNAVAVDPTNLSVIYTESQDNGGALTNGSKAWNNMALGDGGLIRVNPLNPNILYHVQNGSLFESTDGPNTTAASWFDILDVPGTQYFPFTIDQVNPNRLLVGGATPFGPALQESIDGGATWHDLGAPLPVFDQVTSLAISTYQGNFTFDSGFPLVGDQGASTYDGGTIYISDGANLWVTKDDGATWVDRTAGIPAPISAEFGIANLAVDPTNRDIAYLVNNGPAGLGQGRVFLTDDAGQTWQDITGDLPDVPVYSLAIDPRSNTLYVGTDEGVYFSATGGDIWERLGVNQPYVQVTDLALNLNLNTLTAATYGRSIMQFYLSDAQGGAGALNATSGNNVWTGAVLLSGATAIGAEGSQLLQNGLVTASLNIVGTIRDQFDGGNAYLSKVGPGNVIFSGANTYGGTTEVTDGRLIVHNPQALGGTTNGTIVDLGASLQLQSSIAGEPLIINGDGPLPGLNGHNTGSLESVTGNNTYSGNITLGGPSTIGVDTGSTLTITGSITDNGHNFGIAKELTGTLVLTNANSYGGGTTINQGIVNIQNGQALGNPMTLTTVLDGAQLQLQGGIMVMAETLRISGTGVFGTGALENVGGANDWQGPITLARDPGFFPTTNPPTSVAIGALNTGPGDGLTIDGTISQDVNTTMGLTKVGAGVVILDDPDNYDGTTTVSAGRLRIRNGSALGSVINPVVVKSGATLELDGDPTALGKSITVSGKSLILNGTGIGGAGALHDISGNDSWTGPITLQSATSIGVDPGLLLTVSGRIQDPTPAPVPAASLGKVGQGTLALTTANTYTGKTLVNQGILEVTTGSTTINGQPASPLGGVVNEVQAINVAGALTGTFSVTFNGSNTGQLPADIPASGGVGPLGSLQNALNNLPSIKNAGVGGSVTVTKSGSTYIVVFGGALADSNVSPMSAAGQNGTVATPSTVNDGSDRTIVANGASLQLAGGITISTQTLTLNGNGFNGLGALDSASGNNTWITPATVNPFTLASNSAIGADSGSKLTINGVIGESSAGTAMTKVGVGTVVLTGSTSNTYSGLTSVNGGQLQLNKSGGAFAVPGNLTVGNGTGSPGADNAQLEQPNEIAPGRIVTVNSDGVFDLNGQQQGVGALLMTGGKVALTGGTSQFNLNGPVTAAADSAGNPAVISGPGKLNLGSNTQTFTVNGPAFAKPAVADMVISSQIIGSNGAGLVKAGAGTLQLTTNEGYTGTTFLNGGVLLADAPSGATIGAVTLQGGTIGGTGTVGQISPASATLGGTVKPGDGTGIPGILTTAPPGGATTWNSATSLFITILDQTAGDWSTLLVKGNIALGGAALTGFVSPAINIGDSYVILQTTGGSISGRFAEPYGEEPSGDGIAFIGGQKFDVTYTANQVIVTPVKQHAAIAVNSSVTPQSVYGQDVVFTATLTPEPGAGSVPSTDTVTFQLDAGSTNPPQSFTAPVVNNQAVFDPLAFYGSNYGNILSVGTHTIDATFNGDKLFFSSVAPQIKQKVIPATAAITLSSTPVNPMPFQQVTLTASLSAVAPGGGTPSGKVTFWDGAVNTGTKLGSAPTDSTGSAYLALPANQFTGIGTHHIRASFAPSDGNFNPIPASNDYPITVQKGTPAITVVGSPLTSTYSQAVIFTVTVSGPLIPTGTVNFYDGPEVAANNIGSGTLNSNGTLSITTSVLSAGTHTINALYSGNLSYLGGTGSTGFVVSQEQTSASLTSSTSTTAYGQPATFTATVSGLFPGVATPIGTVSFFADGSTTPLGSATLHAQPGAFATGVATFSISTLLTGTHTITAVYGGTNNFATSTSNTVTVLVLTGTQVVITSSTSPAAAVWGQSVTFTATVKGLPPLPSGNPTPTGDVTFKVDGVTVPGSFPLDATGSATYSTSTLSVKAHTITVTYSGDTLFNVSTGNFTQNVIKASTNTTVSTTPNPATTVYGQPLTLSVSVTPQAPSVATPDDNDIVNFYDGAVLQNDLIGSGKLSAGSTTFTTNKLAAGPHTLIAFYMGGAHFNSSQKSVSVSVKPDATSTALTASNTSAVYGQKVTLTATVTPGGLGTLPPQGQVSFYSGTPSASTLLGTVTLNSSGIATLVETKLPALAIPYGLQAVYAGNSNFLTSQTGSGGAWSLTISPDTTTTSVTPSVNPSIVGQAVTFTATVTADAPGNNPGYVPGGAINIVDTTTNTTLATGTLNSKGQFSVTTSALAFGVHTIVANYNGNSNYFGGSSSGLSQSVLYADTVTATSSLSNPVYGQALTFTATVAPSGKVPAGVIPGATVDFFDGANDISGAVTLFSNGTAGVATWSLTTPLTAGTHSITAHYSGDSNFIQNVSKALSQAIGKDGSTSTVTNPQSTSIYGSLVTFTASVTANAPGSGTPTGVVTFWDGAVNTGKKLGTANLDNTGTPGTALFSIGTLGANASGLLHNINVSYGGDSNFTASNGAVPAPVTVFQASTQATLSASDSNSVFGQTVTFSAVVTPTTGGGTPAGSVNFYDGSVTPANLIGSATLDGSGTARLKVSNLSVNTHDVVSVYQGNTNYQASPTSNSWSLTVGAANTSTTLTSSNNPSFFDQTITLTATVTPQAPGSGTPTGQVTFMDGGNAIGTASLVGGKAILTISTLAVGPHSLTASYAGDGLDYVGSAPSNTVNQQVNSQTVFNLAGSLPNNPNGAPLNTAFVLRVTALDASLNRVFSDFDAVSLVLLSGPTGGTLSGNLSGQFKNGIADFNVSVNVLGTYTVQMISNGLKVKFTFSTGRQT